MKDSSGETKDHWLSHKINGLKFQEKTKICLK